jgi:ABC-type cobalamin/Fe3+-siderophores transport system ATPase subunit
LYFAANFERAFVGLSSYFDRSGAFGCGNSTLLKFVGRLCTPSYGEVLPDGRPQAHWRRRTLSSHIGTVMQDDGTRPANHAFHFAATWGYLTKCDTSTAEAEKLEFETL